MYPPPLEGLTIKRCFCVCLPRPAILNPGDELPRGTSLPGHLVQQNILKSYLDWKQNCLEKNLDKKSNSTTSKKKMNSSPAYHQESRMTIIFIYKLDLTCIQFVFLVDELYDLPLLLALGYLLLRLLGVVKVVLRHPTGTVFSQSSHSTSYRYSL